MKRHIILAIVTVTAFAVVLFGVPLAVAIRSLYVTDARTRLEREATLAARDVPTNVTADVDPIELPSGTPSISLGVYGPTGAKIAGAGPDVGDAPVREAAQNRSGGQKVGDRLITAVPVAVNEVVIAVVRGEVPIAIPERHAHLAWALMAALGAAIIGAAAAIAVVVANRMTRPLLRLQEAATRLGHGDFCIRVPPAHVPELDDVGHALTATAHRLGQAMQRERDFSTHASHQLRTPIAGLRLAVETELTTPRPDPTVALHEVLAVTDRLERTVTDLLRLVRKPARAEHLDLAQLVGQIRAHWHASLAAKGRRLVLPGKLPAHDVTATTAAITQALDILLDNASRHGGGTVTLRCDVVRGGLALVVSDEGRRDHPKSDPDVADAGSSDSYGIGLSLAATLVEAEGGRLQHPQPGQPTAYSILLSATAPPAP